MSGAAPPGGPEPLGHATAGSTSTSAPLAPPAPARPRRSILGKVILWVSAAIALFATVAVVPLTRMFRDELIGARREKLDLVAQILVQKSLAEASALRTREVQESLELRDALGELLGARRPDDAEVEARLAEDVLAIVERRAAELTEELGGAHVLVVDHRGLAISVDLDALDDAPNGRAAEVIAVASALAREAGGLAGIPRSASRVTGDRLVHLTPIRSRTGFLEGALLLDAPLAAIDRTVASYLLLRLALIPVLLLITGVAMILVLYRTVLRPLAALHRASRAAIEGDDDGALVPEHQIPDDELGEVIRARNAMVERTRTYQRAIRDKNRALTAQQGELELWAKELERRVAEKAGALERAQEQLLASEKLAATGSLAAGLAHEINNPLASIAAYAEDLLQLAEQAALRELSAFADFPDSLRVIQEQAFRCSQIIRQLMSFARPQPFRLEALDLAVVIEGVLPLVEHKARGREVAIICDLDPEVPLALGDRARLEQVLVNLLVNAFDTIGDRPGRVTMVTRTLASGEVAIDVSDTGPGIPANERRRVFDPFYTTKPPGEGTGLGLSISAALVSRMGGQIEVLSSVGRGATFRISLPAAPTAEQLEAGARASAERSA